MKHIQLWENFKEKPIIIKEIDELIKFNLNIYDVNFTKIEEIGYGGYGIAYDIGNDKIVKITTSFREYEISKRIKSLKNNHLVHVYECGRFYKDSSPLSYDEQSIYFIIKEKIPNLTKRQQEIVDVLISYHYHNFKDLKYGKNELYNQLIKVYKECFELDIPTDDIGADNIGMKNNKLILFDY